MHNKIKEYVNEPLDAKPDFWYINPDLKIVFAKFVTGGIIVASDENFNIMIFNDRCEKLQMLPFGKQVTDACATSQYIFIGILFNRVLCLENKPPFTVVYKVDCEREVYALCRNELHQIRIVGNEGMNFYIDETNFTKKKTNFIAPFYRIN